MKRLVFIALILFCGVILTGFIKWGNIKQENVALAEKDRIEQKESEKKEYENYSGVYKGLLNEDITSITLIGDSVTAGVGASRHSVPENGLEIFNNGKEVYKESSHAAYSWSNKFRSYINSNFHDVDFVNAGIGGKSARWINENKETLLPKERDLVFVMLGTNDRWDNTSVSSYKKDLESILAYVDSKSKYVVLMSPPPALTDGKNPKFKFGMSEVDVAVKEVAQKHNYTFISQYDNFINYTKNNKVDLTKILQKTGSHPIDAGYSLMWDEIKKDLTLKQEY